MPTAGQSTYTLCDTQPEHSCNVVQRLMRHSDIRLTMDRFTDVNLLNSEGAFDTLPRFKGSPAERQRATGTYDEAGANPADSLGTTFGVSGCVSQLKCATPCLTTAKGIATRCGTQTAATARLSGGLHNNSTKRASGFEPPTSSLGSCNDSILSSDDASTYGANDRHWAAHWAFLLRNDTELREILDAWPTLPDAVRAAVVALVRMSAPPDRMDTTDRTK